MFYIVLQVIVSERIFANRSSCDLPSYSRHPEHESPEFPSGAGFKQTLNKYQKSLHPSHQPNLKSPVLKTSIPNHPTQTISLVTEHQTKKITQPPKSLKLPKEEALDRSGREGGGALHPSEP